MTPTMYRTYKRRLQSKDGLDKKSQNSIRAEERKKELLKEQQLTKKRANTLAALKEELEATRTKKLDYDRISDQMLRALGKDRYDPKLKEVDELRRARKKLLMEQQREAEDSLIKEVKLLKDQVGRDARNSEVMEKKLSELQQKIQQKELDVLNITEKIVAVKKKTEEKVREHEDEKIRIDEMKRQKEESCAREVEELTEEKNHLEKSRGQIKKELVTIEQEIARYNHKLETIISWQKTINPKEKRLLDEQLVQWRELVKNDEKEYDAISDLVRVARQKNDKVRKELTVIKPYFSEHTEYEQLRERERLLDRELKDAETLKNLKKWQKEGDLLFEN